MKWMGLNELREEFLSFFEKKAHIRMESFSLVPSEDKSLLLINSGMAPLKKYFLGQAVVPTNRATTCQKCIRTPDIERVGKTARHGTFFEMLGNFSFGDYFKEDATKWALEFFTEVLEIPVEKLYFSVYVEDDEAYEIWTKNRGIPERQMARFGKEDNFWEIGSGPCGPCSEIYYDRGPEKGCGSKDCKVGCDCDRYIEVWNLVFTQFISDGKGNYEKMAKGNIDTGMGLERLACVMQNVDNLFEVDTLKNIITEIEKVSGVKYKSDDKKDVSIRVITDHIRSTVFMVGDGILPSNEGRGYVLRRLLRRAARHGRMLGITKPFLNVLADTIVDGNAVSYPSLSENKDYIKKVISIEEERFSKTIDAGINVLNTLIDAIEKTKCVEKRILSGVEAFKLNDTFGFPFDLTKEILSENNIEIDEDGFHKEMQSQRERARAARAKQDTVGWADDLFSTLSYCETEFVGYEALECSAKVISIGYEQSLEDAVSTDMAEKEGVFVVLDKTPFYAEGGGQVGDIGRIFADGLELNVICTKKTSKAHFIHECVLVSGVLKINQTVTASVDKQTRFSTQRNHTSAHLLQQALIEVLGSHVHQAGSFVDGQRVRFDFTHFSAMKQEEIKQVEARVNDIILAALPVTYKSLPIAQAKKLGAQALFGEKYGDIVRVIEVENFSTEFCGGTHVFNTSQLGLFKILSESSVAAGIRRIEGTTGYGVLSLIEQKDALINSTAYAIKLNNPADLPVKLTALNNDLKNQSNEIEKLKNEIAEQKIDGLFAHAQEIDGIKLFAISVSGTDSETLRQISLKIKEKVKNSVAVLCGGVDGKVTISVSCGSEAVAKGLSAGEIVKKVAALTGGTGGGKAEYAMAGAKDITMIDEAIIAVPSILKELISKKV